MGRWDAVGAHLLLAFKPSSPPGQRILPRLLTPIDSQVDQPEAVVDRPDAAPRRSVGLENIDPCRR